MAQLKMYWFPGTPIKDEPLPEGYSISNYCCEADKMAWVECCKNGLVGDDSTAEAFDESILSRPLDPYKDVFFIDFNGEHVGTVTAYRDPETNTGDMHMVGIRTDFRGKKLSKYLSIITCKKLEAEGVKFIHLTTDEWRKPAVKGYLNAGFLPVEYDVGMEERWVAELAEIGVDSVQMVNDDGTPYKVIYAAK